MPRAMRMKYVRDVGWSNSVAMQRASIMSAAVYADELRRFWGRHCMIRYVWVASSVPGSVQLRRQYRASSNMAAITYAFMTVSRTCESSAN